MLSTAVKTNSEVFAQPPVLFPSPIVLENFVKAWTVAPFTQFLFNTVFIAVTGMVGAILSTSLVGFSFARLQWAGRDFWFMVMLSTIMLPSAVTLVPTFILFKTLGWVNTFAPLIVPAWLAGSAFNIFLFRQFFRGIPKDLDEAATVDGASSLWIYWRVILPLSRPAIGAVAIFSFIFHWNDFLGPLIYLNKQHLFTLSLGLSLLQGSSEFNGQVVSWNYLMADSVAVMFPCILIFFFFQRYFIRGVSLAGVQR
jgi:multiple sugar transport system permease protein